MAGPCVQRPHCHAARCDYCPCIVRGLLAEYAELLEQRTVLLERHHGDATRVQGKRPAHEVLEGQIARKADVAVALLELCADYPQTGRAVALAYGLDAKARWVEEDGRRVVRGSVRFIGYREPPPPAPKRPGEEQAPTHGRLRTPPVKTIAVLLASSGAHTKPYRLARRALKHDAVRETIAEGVTWMAQRLGWAPGEVEEG